MMNMQRHKALLLYLNQKSSHFPFSLLRFSTDTSDDSRSFAVSYLINNLGFSLQSASKLCSTKNVLFKTAEKPNSVLTFLRNRGFSDPQLHNMIAKAPRLLSCDPCKKVLPKFEFFLSKGISNSDIVNLVSKKPYVLSRSVKNHIVPTYDLIYRFLQSDKDIFALLNYYPTLISNSSAPLKIRMLIENGMTDSTIATLLVHQCTMFSRTSERELLKVVEELKDLGFHPSKAAFFKALKAKLAVSRTGWNEKVDAFNKWGWSHEDIMKAFKSRPQCMLTSVNKINLVMSYWVNHLGWDALALAKRAHVFTLSFERRIIPRATVVQFLLKKGFREKNASLTSPFCMTEKLFLDTFIKRFEEESSYLFNLYEEKKNHAYTGDKSGMS